MIICWYSVIHTITMSIYKLLIHDLKRVVSHTLIQFTCESHANCMLVTYSQTAADMFTLRRDKCKCDNLSESFTLVKRCVITQCNHHWCQWCAHYLMRVITNSLVTDYHFSTEKLNYNYCMSMRHQCVLVCAPEFCMSFADYSQVPSNCDQSLTAVLTQIRLLHTDDASAPTEDSVCASAWVLSCQMTVSVRSSDLVRVSLLLTAGADPVTGTDVWMLMNMIQQFTEVVATAVSMSFTCESLTCH